MCMLQDEISYSFKLFIFSEFKFDKKFLKLQTDDFQ